MHVDMFLSLIGVLIAAKGAVDNLPNDNPHINKLAKKIETFKADHTERAKFLLKYLADVEKNLI